MNRKYWYNCILYRPLKKYSTGEIILLTCVAVAGVPGQCPGIRGAGAVCSKASAYGDSWESSAQRLSGGNTIKNVMHGRGDRKRRTVVLLWNRRPNASFKRKQANRYGYRAGTKGFLWTLMKPFGFMALQVSGILKINSGWCLAE